jgi:lipoprotein-releasing system permease protein
MNYEFFIARRYLTAKRKQAFISVITFISILGITIGVMALIIAIALITGFQSDVQDKILGSTAHIMVQGLFREEGLKDYPQLMEKIKSREGVVSVSPVVYNYVLITGPYQTTPGILRGVDFKQEQESSEWFRDLEGSIPQPGQKRPGIILGRDLALNIGAGIGDAVSILAPSFRLSPTALIPRQKQFTVTGIFYTGLYEFDNATALISLPEAQKLFKLGDRVSMIQVRISNIFDADKVADRIRAVLPADAYVTTWMEMNKPLFSALKLEKNLLFLTITLIVFVAALNIVATLILMVMDKTRDIGILLAMGATSRNIRKIFFFQGAMIGVIGTAIGTALGLLWNWLANTFELIKIPGDIYHIAYVPFRLKPLDLALIIGVALLISFFSTLFPAHRASKVDPVVALKYE